MLTRRAFAGRLGFAAAASGMLPAMVYAQRAAVGFKLPKDVIWLNGNEFPAGPPASSIKAMTTAIPKLVYGLT